MYLLALFLECNSTTRFGPKLVGVCHLVIFLHFFWVALRGGAGTKGGDGKGDGEGAYLDTGSKLKKDAAARVNAALGEEGLDLVYWDYSSSSKEHYKAMLEKHEPLVRGNNTASGQRNVMMSMGLWTWNRFWAALYWAMATLEAGVAAAHEGGVDSVYVTAWADDGAEHAPISSAAGKVCM